MIAWVSGREGLSSSRVWRDGEEIRRIREMDDVISRRLHVCPGGGGGGGGRGREEEKGPRGIVRKPRSPPLMGGLKVYWKAEMKTGNRRKDIQSGVLLPSLRDEGHRGKSTEIKAHWHMDKDTKKATYIERGEHGHRATDTYT